MPLAKQRLQPKSENSRSSAPGAKEPKGLRISIIGAGRMGSALGRALRHEGHQIEVAVTKHASKARRAGQLIGGGAISLTARQLVNPPPAALNRLLESKLVLISTPDDVLERVAKQLAALFERWPQRTRTKPLALHTSGAISSEILGPLRKVGFAVGSFHPLVSVADGADRRNVFRGAHFCVEGDRPAKQIGRSLVKDLGAHAFTIAPEVKPLYHAAATISSGHIVALFDLAIEMLEACGLSKRRAREILVPLLNSTLTNVTTKTPAQALTGPFSRGDVATIRRHLAAIKAHKLSEAAAVYSVLGQRALRLARFSKSEAKRLTAIANLLSSTSMRVL